MDTQVPEKGLSNPEQIVFVQWIRWSVIYSIVRKGHKITSAKIEHTHSMLFQGIQMGNLHRLGNEHPYNLNFTMPDLADLDLGPGKSGPGVFSSLI